MQPAQAVSQDEKLSDFSDDYWRGSSSSNCSEAMCMELLRRRQQQHPMRNIQQRVLQIHTAQQAAAAAAANTAAAAAVKAQKHEAGPEAALGPVGAVEAGGGGGAQGRGR
ncbi:hypothetical protein PLESTF_000726800 [Pleodorina starrii]|nr:hypothetical protein PLESTF_000726800 [Pleodorina starrii]